MSACSQITSWRPHAARRVATFALLIILILALPGAALAHGPKPQPKQSQEASSETAAELWGCPMCESVRQDHPGSCPMCGMDLIRMEPRPGVGDDTDVDQPLAAAGGGASGGSAPMMPGVPAWLFYATALSILILSFVLFEIWGRRRRQGHTRTFRWNVFRIPKLGWLLKRPWFQFSLQLPVVGLFALVIAAGLFGNPSPEKNIAPILTWTIWWTFLVLVIIFVGKIWCTVCPWMAIADWVAKIGLWRRDHDSVGLGKRWPKGLRNIWLATILFVGLTWLELGFGVTEKPWLTALLGLLMVLACIATLFIFERKAFCRYACLVGRVSGLYSMFAASELRPGDRDLCRTCASKDCYHGNRRGIPCPTGQYLGSMDANTYCIMCMECLKTCPKDNIAWNARPFGADLVDARRTRVDEAYLAVIMLSMSAFHGLTMTPVWEHLVNWIMAVTGWGYLAAFSFGMAGMIVLPLLAYYGICVLMKLFARDRVHSARFLFIKFSYSLLPIALFYHLAHNLQHMFFEGKKLIRAASDPFGWGWDLFGTASIPIDAVLPVGVGWGLQVALIIIGHLFGIRIAHKVAFSVYDKPRYATMSQIPILAAMLLFSFQSLWLLAQPMVMRTAM